MPSKTLLDYYLMSVGDPVFGGLSGFTPTSFFDMMEVRNWVTEPLTLLVCVTPHHVLSIKEFMHNVQKQAVQASGDQASVQKFSKKVHILYTLMNNIYNFTNI